MRQQWSASLFPPKPVRKCNTSQQVHSIKKICSFTLKVLICQHKPKNVLTNVEIRFKVQMLARSQTLICVIGVLGGMNRGASTSGKWESNLSLTVKGQGLPSDVCVSVCVCFHSINWEGAPTYVMLSTCRNRVFRFVFKGTAELQQGWRFG